MRTLTRKKRNKLLKRGRAHKYTLDKVYRHLSAASRGYIFEINQAEVEARIVSILTNSQRAPKPQRSTRKKKQRGGPQWTVGRTSPGVYVTEVDHSGAVTSVDVMP